MDSAGQLTVAKQNASEQVPIAEFNTKLQQLIDDTKNNNRNNNARFQIIPTNPTEDTLKHEPGEHPIDYIKRLTRWLREQAKQEEISDAQPVTGGGKNTVGTSHDAMNDLAGRR